MTVVVTIQGTARALKHVRALSRPGKNGEAQAASRGTGLGNWKCSLFQHRCDVFGYAFAAPLLRVGRAVAALWLRLWCVFGYENFSFFATILAAPLRRFCCAFGASVATPSRRLCYVFAMPWPRFCCAMGAFFAHRVEDETTSWYFNHYSFGILETSKLTRTVKLFSTQGAPLFS